MSFHKAHQIPYICQWVGYKLKKVLLAEEILAFHFIDDILLVGPDKGTIQQGLNILLIHMGQHGWTINKDKV